MPSVELNVVNRSWGGGRPQPTETPRPPAPVAEDHQPGVGAHEEARPEAMPTAASRTIAIRPFRRAIT